MKKAFVILVCICFLGKVVDTMIKFTDLNYFLTRNESTSYHAGQIVRLLVNIVVSFGMASWFFKMNIKAFFK